MVSVAVIIPPGFCEFRKITDAPESSGRNRPPEGGPPARAAQWLKAARRSYHGVSGLILVDQGWRHGHGRRQDADQNPLTFDEAAAGQPSAEKIDGFLRKWLRLLPHPFTGADRQAGYRYDISILQAEFSLTQVLDTPAHGRLFFEHVIRENLDLGRPEQVRLIFNRKITRRTPGQFRTRIITKDVTPSLNASYKNTRIKQYHKENRALRTETTINNTYDFGIGRRLVNLPKLRAVGFAANRRLLDVERLSHDCMLAEDTFQAVNSPVTQGRQRASGLRFGDARVHALWHALILFRQLADGFRAADLRRHLAALSGRDADAISQGAITYQLRRLRLHGLIERLPGSLRYASPASACARRCSSRACTTASCAPASPPHFPLCAPLMPRSSAHSTQSMYRSTHGSAKPNSLLET
jgi:hypothetical protein